MSKRPVLAATWRGYSRPGDSGHIKLTFPERAKATQSERFPRSIESLNFSESKLQQSQTRTSPLQPNVTGKQRLGHVLLEQSEQTEQPQLRQWCRGRSTAKVPLHMLQAEASSQTGGACARDIVSACSCSLNRPTENVLFCKLLSMF